MNPIDCVIATYDGMPDLDPDDRLLLGALREHGVTVAVGVWSDPTVEWSAARLCVLRSTWDYPKHFARFSAWLDAVEQTTVIRNEPALVRWNSHKQYLRELELAGIPIVPTAWLARRQRADLRSLLAAAVAVAGVIAGGVPAWQVPAAREQAVLDTDLGGVLNLARIAVPALLRRPEPRSGRFLAVASAAAARGLPMLAAYCAAKAGVVGFIRALAVELGGTGITANAVSPGSTSTPILDESARLYGLPGAESFAGQQPLGRLLRPAEVAAVLAFLAGAGASGMTGAVVPVDGGLSL